MPAVCRFYLKGYCRYGQNCRFEHPGENTPKSGFSFTKALEEKNSPASPPSGFSFSRALETTTHTSFNNPPSFFGTPNQQYNPYQQNRNINFSTPIFSRPPDTLGFPSFSFAKAANQVTSIGISQPAINTEGGFFNNPYQSGQLAPQTSSFNAYDIDMRAPQEATLQQQQIQGNIQLTEPEIKAFQSAKFQFRQIPVRPPPDSFCH